MALLPAPEIKAIAERIIDEFHPHLRNAYIVYLFTEKTRTKNGKVVLGTAAKASPNEEYLSRRDPDDEDSGADFILIFGYQEWQALIDSDREALVDHELCHCGHDLDDNGDMKYVIRGHDVEEFTDIIKRRGLWRPNVMQMARAMQQLRLPLDERAETRVIHHIPNERAR